MATPLPPDPYLALGLPRDASAATIKSTYRKLILKFHPDKVQDAAQKQIASDQFHKVQTAYEIIGEEDKRARYDAQCKLVELRKDMLKKDASAQAEARPSSYSRMRPESPARPNYTPRASERSERVHVEERRPYDAEPEYFDRPRSTARKDYEYERSSPKRPTPAPKTEKERARASRQSAKENERARQREKTRQTTRDTQRDRDLRDREFKYSYAEPETASSSDSDGVVEPPRYARREEDDRRRERDSYYDSPRRQKEEAARAFYMEDRSHHKMQSHEMSARDYIERSGGRSRQYPEATRPRSPQRVSTKDKVEYIKRSEGRPAVMVRRGSGKPRPASREPEEPPRRESPRRESPRRDRDRARRASHDYSDMPRKPTLNQTKSAPEHIQIPETPRRAFSMQTDAKPETDFQPPPMRRADTMPNQGHVRRERESTRKPQKASGLRRTETTDSLPTPAATPEPMPAKYGYGREYADDNEFATPNGYRTEVHEPANAGSSRKVTRSPSPIKEERAKEERGRAASSRYPAAPQRPHLGSSRTTSYVYTPQGLQDMPAGRPSMQRSESVRTEVPLYGEIPTSRSSPRQTRTRHSPPRMEPQYQHHRPDDMKYQTGYPSSRRASEAMRPSYGRGNSYTSQAAY